MSASEITPAERAIAEARRESIKAGLIGAGAVGLAAGLARLGAILLQNRLPEVPLFFLSGPSAGLLNLAVALCSGFFFGVTYRYIIRQDDNLHLGSGAVGAFAFVRSLAQIEATWTGTFTPLIWLLITGESFLWFAVARYSLDWAIRQKWVKPLD